MLRTDESNFLTIAEGGIWFYYIFCGTHILPTKMCVALSFSCWLCCRNALTIFYLDV